MRGVRGIQFRGCKFQNMRDNNEFANENFYGFGILASESGFSVTDYCTAPVPPSPPVNCAPDFTISSSFKNLFVGIRAGDTEINGVLPYSFLVINTLFEGNWTGAQSIAGSRAFITRNSFKLGKIPPSFTTEQSREIRGIDLYDTHKSFVVQDNNFYRDPAISQEVVDDNWPLTGIKASSLGEFSNIIRKNYFNDLRTGNQSVGANATADGVLGLVYLCNENSGNDYFDFNIEDGSRIKKNQGLNDINGNVTATAGNYFSHTGPDGSDSDFKYKKNGIGYKINYQHGITSSEIPQFYDPNQLDLSSVNQPRSCESIFCDPPCRTESEIMALRQQIVRDAFSSDSLNILLLAGGADQRTTDLRSKARSFLIYRIQTNVAEVTTHLAYAEGADNAVFRDMMAKSNCYDADLALANDYLGSNETGNYSTIINGIGAKYQLSGVALDEFNEYRTVTDMMAQHYSNGGNKYNLGTLQVDWLKDMAENGFYFRTRGMARRILQLYGYNYPLDYRSNPEERSNNYILNSGPELFSIFPNPADQQIRVHIETGKTSGEFAHIRFIRPDGVTHEEKYAALTQSGDFIFATQSLAAGIYFVQVRLESGKVQTKRISIIH